MEPEIHDPRHPAERIADDLTLGFLAGEIKPGDKLPSVNELMEEYGVANATVQRAMKLLKEKDLAYSVNRRGTFIRQEARPEDYEASRPEGSPLFQQILSHLESIGDEISSISERLAYLESRQRRDDEN